MNLKILLVKIVCKTIVLLSFIRTMIRRFLVTDHTKILVDYMTLAQKSVAIPLAIPELAPSRVAVFIPFRDQWQLTKRCLDSLLNQKIDGCDILICLIDNGSKEAETLIGVKSFEAGQLAQGFSLRIVTIDQPFNYSLLNNFAARTVDDWQADWYLFLNNDIELTEPNALSELLRFAGHAPKAGAIGCTLRYPTGQIQHLFVAPGVKIVAAHPFRGFRLSDDALWFDSPRPVAAVTGAALLLKRAQFWEVEGFDENLATLGQDVDLCLKLQKAGYVNWVLPSVSMIHHESVSRGKALNRHEVAYVYKRWGSFLTQNPFYSTSLSRWSERPLLTIGEPAYPWERVLPR